MSIDHYYARRDGKWLRIDDYVFSDRRREDDPDFSTAFWVDICHGRNFCIDERYYFPDRGSAIDFYSKGWKERQFLDDVGNEVGLDHSGLYLEGRLIDGLSIHGDPPGHEGENLREAMGRFCSHLEELESKRKETRTKRPKERYTQ